MTDELPSGERGVLHDPSELPRPVLWPDPPRGDQPVPVHGRDEGGPEEEVAERRLPFAWAGIGLCIVAVIVLGLAVGRQSWILAAAGLVVGAIGGAVVLWSRLMDAATVGQSMKG